MIDEKTVGHCEKIRFDCPVLLARRRMIMRRDGEIMKCSPNNIGKRMNQRILIVAGVLTDSSSTLNDYSIVSWVSMKRKRAT